MNRLVRTVWAGSAAAILCVASLAVADVTPLKPSADELAKERQFVEQWKARRLASLTSESGWLTLVGLVLAGARREHVRPREGQHRSG